MTTDMLAQQKPNLILQNINSQLSLQDHDN